jgi:hypothetical protein
VQPGGAKCSRCGQDLRRRRGGSPHASARPSTDRCSVPPSAAGEHAVAAGILTISDIRSGDPTACTLPRDDEPLLPLSDICTSDAAPGDILLTFIVDVERSKIRWLVRFRFIRRDQKDDLSTIIAGLKCIGQPPSISRIR